MNKSSVDFHSLAESIRRPIRAACLSVALVFTFAASAVSGDEAGGRQWVSGDSVFSDCGDFAIEMSGDLNGCLEIFPTHYTCDELNGFALYRERGTEVFTDNDGVSSFRTKYDLEGTYSPGFCTSFDFSTQLAGGCDHKVFSGEGKFRGANGIITFNDIIPVSGVSGASNFLYHGKLKYQD